MPAQVHIIPVPVADEIRPGDSLARKLVAALKAKKLVLKAGDILIVKHKIVSKAEGRQVLLDTITPSSTSREWGKKYQVDPRITELAVGQSTRIVRREAGILITETHHGLVCANSGIDVSNVDGGRSALLLPEDPDNSAALLHRELKKRLHLSIPVIITDSFGRPWREGLTEVAIGVAGMLPLADDRGMRDPYGYTLRVSVEAIADELACAAGLVCGKLSRVPACVVRGYPYREGHGSARDLIRPASRDLFR